MVRLVRQFPGLPISLPLKHGTHAVVYLLSFQCTRLISCVDALLKLVCTRTLWFSTATGHGLMGATNCAIPEKTGTFLF